MNKCIFYGRITEVISLPESLGSYTQARFRLQVISRINLNPATITIDAVCSIGCFNNPDLLKADAMALISSSLELGEEGYTFFADFVTVFPSVLPRI
jgi:hypothetical protein